MASIQKARNNKRGDVAALYILWLMEEVCGK